MTWHILTIIFGALLLLICFNPVLLGHFNSIVLLGKTIYLSFIFAALVFIFAFMSLESYRRLRNK